MTDEAVLERLAAKLATAIAAELRPLSTKELWTSLEVSRYLKCSRREVCERLMLTKGFPAPIRLPAPQGVGLPKWKPEEIIAYAESRQEKRA